MMNPIKIKRKVVLLGDSAVGKTSVIRRFVMDKFDDKYITTIGTKVTKKEVSITKGEANIQLTLMIWDILGQQGYTSIQARSYKGADGVLFVCDLTRKDSLENIETYWLAELEKVADSVPAILIGNKVDLQDDRKVDEDTIAGFAEKLGCQYFLSSAKTGENVERLFKSLGEIVVEGIGINGKGDSEIDRELVTLPDAADAILIEFVDSYVDQ
jgi:small GTP-binding protein